MRGVAAAASTRPVSTRYEAAVRLRALLLLTVFLVGCGGSDASDGGSGEGSDSASASPTKVAPAVSQFAAERVYRWEAASSTTGSTSSLVAEFGDVLRVDSDVPADFTPALDACQLDTERDAVLPLRLRATNTSDGFTFDLNIGFKVDRGDYKYESDLPLEAAVLFDSGPSCAADSGEIGSNLLSVEFARATTGVERTIDALLVIRNYYSPASPGGKEDVLSAFTGIFSLSDGEGRPQATCFSAPSDNFRVQGLLEQRLGTSLYGGVLLTDAATDPGEAINDEIGPCAGADSSSEGDMPPKDPGSDGPVGPTSAELTGCQVISHSDSLGEAKPDTKRQVQCRSAADRHVEVSFGTYGSPAASARAFESVTDVPSYWEDDADVPYFEPWRQGACGNDTWAQGDRRGRIVCHAGNDGLVPYLHWTLEGVDVVGRVFIAGDLIEDVDEEREDIMRRLLAVWEAVAATDPP